jgi:hypothetical protein
MEQCALAEDVLSLGTGLGAPAAPKPNTPTWLPSFGTTTAQPGGQEGVKWSKMVNSDRNMVKSGWARHPTSIDPPHSLVFRSKGGRQIGPKGRSKLNSAAPTGAILSCMAKKHPHGPRRTDARPAWWTTSHISMARYAPLYGLLSAISWLVARFIARHSMAVACHSMCVLFRWLVAICFDGWFRTIPWLVACHSMACCTLFQWLVAGHSMACWVPFHGLLRALLCALLRASRWLVAGHSMACCRIAPLTIRA